VSFDNVLMSFLTKLRSPYIFSYLF